MLYLAFVSKEPFFSKWIDGSFSFFVALVLCNIVRARVVAGMPREDAPEEDRTDGPASRSEKG